MFQKFIGLVAGLALIGGATAPIAKAEGVTVTVQVIETVVQGLEAAGKGARVTQDFEKLLVAAGAAGKVAQVTAILSGAGSALSKAQKLADLINGVIATTASKATKQQIVKDITSIAEACTKALKYKDSASFNRSYGQLTRSMRGTGRFSSDVEVAAAPTGNYSQVGQQAEGLDANEKALLARVEKEIKAGNGKTITVKYQDIVNLLKKEIGLVGPGMTSDTCGKLSLEALRTYLSSTSKYGLGGFNALCTEYARIMGVSLATAQRNVCMLAQPGQGCQYWGPAIVNQCNALGIKVAGK